MRYRAMLLGLVLLAAGCGGGGGKTTASASPPPPLIKPPAGKLKVFVKGKTPRPKANAKWPYMVQATDSAGKTVGGKLTVQVVDPVGNAHTVTYDNTKKAVKNFPFHGVFRDYLQFPAQSVGFELTVKATVKNSHGSGTGTFGVKPK